MRRHGRTNFQSSSRLRRGLLIVGSVTLLVPSNSTAQRIQGQVLQGTTGRPVELGFVVLLDSGGAEIRRMPTDAAGAFRFDIRAGGFFVRSERIGFRPTTSDLIVLQSRDTVAVELVVEPIPYALDRIEVSESQVCGLSEDASQDMLAVWQEAEKALRAAVWTAGQRAYRYTVNMRDRRVREDGVSIREERDSTAEALTSIPFRAPRPAILAGGGYVVPQQDGTTSYYAPDANVLLHDTFLETHCFSVIRDGEWIGLDFEPKPDRELPDVRGTLWIHAASAQLDEVEYRYTGLDRNVTDRSVGGSIEFMPVPSGDWIVHRWHIRMPELGWVAADRRAQARVRGYQDAMGEVLAIHNRNGETVYSVQPAVLQGMVFDSISAQPLANAYVRIAGSNRATTTAPSGRFTLSGPLRGQYTITVEHPRLDSLFLSMDVHDVTLEPGETESIRLATPSLETVWHRLCPDDALSTPGSDDTANVWAVFGRVTSGGSPESAAEGVTVSANWRAVPRTHGALVLNDWNATFTTGDDGTYVLCGLPVETPIRLTAFDSTRASRTQTLHFDRAHTAVSVADVQTYQWPLPFWRRDIRISDAPSLLAGLTGRFLDAELNAIPGVSVSVAGRDTLTVTSDSSGHFVLDSLPAGPQLITIRRVGFRPVAYSATLNPGETYHLPAEVTTLVAGSGHELDPILVTAERAMTGAMRGFQERREMGFGDHLTRDEWENNPPAVATDLLRRMEGIRVSPNGNYGRPSSTGQRDLRRVVIMNRRSADRGECPLLVFLNGMLMGTTENLNVDFLINVRAVEAVETYMGASSIPAMFNVSGARCGVVAFWTR